MLTQYGLYTAWMATFVYCLLGTSKDVNLGPAAVMSLLVAEFGHFPGDHDDATYAIALSLVCGVFQIIMGILHVGQWSLTACSPYGMTRAPSRASTLRPAS